MSVEIQQVLDSLSTKQSKLMEGIETMRGEVKLSDKATTETKQRVDELMTDINGLRTKFSELALKVDTNAYSDGGRVEKSIGTEVVESAQYKQMLSAGGDKSGAVQVKSLYSLERKDVTTAAASTGAALPAPIRLPIFGNPHIALRIRDLMNVVPTTQTMVEYVKYTFTNNAAIVIDTTVTPNARENVLKPKSDMTMTKANAAAETIAHWVAASKQSLADIPQIRGIIDGELMYGLKFKEEAEILNGDGTAGHLNGLRNQATAYDTTLLGASPTKIDVLRAAALQAELAEYPTDAYILNPRDWFDIEIVKDDLGRYIIGNPQGNINQTMWGLPVVKSKSMPYGNFLTGSFQMGATLYDREQANIEVRDTHADFFIRNMVAILCEERLMLVVSRPQCFIKGAF